MTREIEADMKTVIYPSMGMTKCTENNLNKTEIELLRYKRKLQQM